MTRPTMTTHSKFLMFTIGIGAFGAVQTAAAQSACSMTLSNVKAPLDPDPGTPLSIRDGCRDDFHIEFVRRTSFQTVNPPRREPIEVDDSLLRESDWSGGWGWSDAPSSAESDLPYCILAESFSVLERAGAEAESDRFVLKEAYDYVVNHVEHMVPVCDTDETLNAHSGTPGVFGDVFNTEDTKIYQNYFDNMASERASTLIHEAWHRGSSRVHGGGKDDDGNKRDNRYHNIYDYNDHLEGEGVSVYSVQVAWLEDYVQLAPSTDGGRNAIDRANRDAAMSLGNEILRMRFRIPTVHRISYFEPSELRSAADTTSLADPTIEYSAYEHDESSSSSENKLLAAIPAEDSCALTGLQGAFREAGDGIFIRTETRGIGNGERVEFWSLEADNVSGNKPENRTEGQARCFPDHPLILEQFYGIEDDESSLTRSLVSGAGPMNGDDHVCFLMGVEGRLEGDRDGMKVRLNSDNMWEIHMFSNTRDSKNDYTMKVGCIRAKRTEFIDLDEVSERVRFSGGTYSHACALSSVTGRMWREKDAVYLTEHDPINLDRDLECRPPITTTANECTDWHLEASGDASVLEHQNPEHRAVCFEL